MNGSARPTHRSSKRYRPMSCQPSGNDASAEVQACVRAPSGCHPRSVRPWCQNFWRLYPRVMDEVLPEERRLRPREACRMRCGGGGDEAGARRLMDEYWARDAPHYKTWATVTEGATVAPRADGESIRKCRIERLGEAVALVGPGRA